MWNFLFLTSLVMSMTAFANDPLIKKLEREGFSQNDIDLITKVIEENKVERAKVIMDRDTGRSKMKTGTVKFFNESKGMGFILSESGDLHEFISPVIFENGDLVNFEVQEGKSRLAVVQKFLRSINDTKKSCLSIIR